MNSDESGKPPLSAASGLSELQFDRAEPLHSASAACVACGSPIIGSYYALNGHTLCASCAHVQQKFARPEPSNRDLLLAGLYGIGAALAGTGIYFAILALSGYEIGWIAVAVGWLVGKAVQKGSRGVGGRKLQIMAVVLTYFSIVGSYIPLTVKYAIEKSSHAGDRSSAHKPATAMIETEPASLSGLLGSLLILLGYCIAAPFLNGFSGIIGLFIIFIGLFEAWKLNRRAPVMLEGPFPAPRSDAHA